MRVTVVLSILLTTGCLSTPAAEGEEQAALRVMVVVAPQVDQALARPEVIPPTTVLGSPRRDPQQAWSPPPPQSPDMCPASVQDVPFGDAARPDDPRLDRSRLMIASKSQRRLWLYDQGDLQGCWRIGLGFSPQGDKQREGDGRTPQGWYRTSDKPWSTFDGAIAIHYPNREDARRGVAAGTISRRTRIRIEDAIRQDKAPPQRTAMGGAVLIHGGGSSTDWTLGCIALDDADLADLRGRLPSGKRADLLVVP